jgi:hypothetical protein
MDTSIYQNLKLQILEVLNLSKDAVHIYIGMGVFLLAVVIWKRGRIKGVCLSPVFCIALLMEILDIKDDICSLGYVRWAASIHDFLNTSFWPMVLVVLTWLKKIRHDIGE